MEENSQESRRIQQRQAALEQLRENRGGVRQSCGDSGNETLKQAGVVLKRYAQQEKVRHAQALASREANDLAVALENLCAENLRLEDSAEISADEVSSGQPWQQLRQIQEKRALLKQLEAQAGLESATSFASATQQQLIGQLLSEDFLENTRLWLSSTEDPEKEQPSTSVEELEDCQKQVKYRMKVLKVLLAETQGELDYVELQLRAARGSLQSSSS